MRAHDAELEPIKIKGPEFYREGYPNAQKRLVARFNNYERN